MESRLVLEYVLYVSGKATAVVQTLEEAQIAAGQFLSRTAPLRIESAVAPAPTRTWNYDCEIRQWVELVRT